ncbi:matrix-remodeling-associated protein 7 isoform X1 [Corapipo altera]|uniref:matrix-remodeling-associated protein 7 isoform X1 n=1 Tax=Corapipo altera TaxID=415028 RepID=UPI000FD6A57E|nr:matrix-remodeling-associated protein 7 isoform X1 [Corapipo altera]
MDLAVDLYLAVPLLFTVLAIVLASVFVKLRGGGGERAAERPREPAAEPAREDGPGGEAAGAGPGEGPEDEGSRVPVEEVGAGEEGKEAVAQQREAAAEPGPAAEPSPVAAESIPRQPPAEPRQAPPEPRQAPPEPRQAPQEPHQPPPERRQPDHREDVESKIPPLGASPGSSLGHTGQAEDVCGHATLPSHAEEEEVDSENEKLVVREPEDEDAADGTFSFKYSPGKLRGNQYKSMMSKEELEEEQRPRRRCKGAGLLPGKLLGELSTVAQPCPASFSLSFHPSPPFHAP